MRDRIKAALANKRIQALLATLALLALVHQSWETGLTHDLYDKILDREFALIAEWTLDDSALKGARN